ncbi:hypothetical protein Plhal703r1_c50g0153921 [Plasmopara halstedii]
MKLDNPPATDIVTAASIKLTEIRRLKHREYVKKSYKKKLTTLDSLRRELEELDKQHSTMLLSESSNNQRRDERPSLKKWYQHENHRLYQLNACYMKIESRMGQLLDSEATKAPLPGLCNVSHSEKLSTGARVFGWIDQREVIGRTLNLHFKSSLVLVLVICCNGVVNFSNPLEFPKVYGSALKAQFHLLQQIDADTILFYRRITVPANDTRAVKTVFLLSRRQVEEGYLLLFRSIDKELVHFKEVPEKPKDCLFHFGGTATTTLWLREVLFIAVRWEGMAVGSQFSLTAE